jgi:hypothetical protein
MSPPGTLRTPGAGDPWGTVQVLLHEDHPEGSPEVRQHRWRVVATAGLAGGQPARVEFVGARAKAAVAQFSQLDDAHQDEQVARVAEAMVELCRAQRELLRRGLR